MKKAILFLIPLMFSLHASSQDWQWRWGTKASNHLYSTSANGLAADMYNNISGWIQYDTSLWFSDTVLHHPLTTGGFAFPLYNPVGKLIKVIDLWSDTGRVWNYPIISFDQIGNTYLSCTFSGRFFINTDTIEPVKSNKPFTPQLFLARFGPSGSMEWVKIIHGNGQVFLEGMTTGPGNNLYLEARSYTTFGPPGWVVFFDQDSVNFTGYHTSLMCVDTNGIIRWRKAVSSGYYYDNRGLFCGDDGNIYIHGTSYLDVIAGSDTIKNAIPRHTIDPPFLAGFDSSGILKQGVFLDLKVNSFEMNVDNAGAIYFGGRIIDTLFWGASHIVIQGDTTCTIFGKVSSSGLPLWYNLAKTRKSPGQGEQALDFKLGLSADSLVFAAGCSRHFRFNDSVYYVGEAPEVITGICSPEGQVLRTLVSRNTYGMQCTDLILDHCKNVILAGGFRDSSYFGPDTLKSWSIAYHDGYIAALGRYAATVIDLGPDRSACGFADLTGPPGFVHYRWNDGLSVDKSLHVTESGKYWLSAAGNDLCWATDTIVVTIDEMPVLDLGPDTTIFRMDHLVFSIQPGYDHYAWSTGDTARQMVFYGYKLDFGDHLIWASVQDGTCTMADSVWVRVVPGIGISENREPQVRLFPNPSSGMVSLESEEKILCLSIRSVSNDIVLQDLREEPSSGRYIFDLSDIPAGLYFLTATTEFSVYTIKLIRRSP